MIAAIVLGALSLFSLYLAFGGSIFSRKTSVTVSASPTPTPSSQTVVETARVPTQEEIFLEWTTTPINYEPGNFYAPDAGRNIFAFYEPPAPTPYVTPVPVIQMPTPFKEVTPIPTPTPPLQVDFVTPQSVYAGAKTFRLEVAGSKFTPESRIIFNGAPLRTTFISPQHLVAEVPANMILGEGPRQIMVDTPDGKLYSNPVTINVQAPPKPQFQYIGMIGRTHYNNDTAVFRDQDKKEFSARLTDVVAGRFRVVSISGSEIVLEDTSLGFRHKLPLYRPEPGKASPNSPSGYPNVNLNNYVPYTPPQQPQPNYQQAPPPPPPQQQTQPQEIPGIPSNIPRYVNPSDPTRPQPRPQRTPVQKKDDDDDDDDNVEPPR